MLHNFSIKCFLSFKNWKEPVTQTRVRAKARLVKSTLQLIRCKSPPLLFPKNYFMMKFPTFIFGLFQIFHVSIVFPTLIFVLLKVPPIQGKVLENPNLLKMPSSNIMIRLSDPTMPLIRKIAEGRFTNRADHLLASMQSLKRFTGESQARILDFLSLFQDRILIQPMWVDNVIFVKGAFPVLIKLLLANFFPAIEQIRGEILIKLPTTFDTKLRGTAPTRQTPAWGVSRIGCSNYWDLFGDGTGCTAASKLNQFKIVVMATKFNLIFTPSISDRHRML